MTRLPRDFDSQVTAECITLCVIDDCLDSDVPLLEVSLAELNLEQVCFLTLFCLDFRKLYDGPHSLNVYNEKYEMFSSYIL